LIKQNQALYLAQSRKDAKETMFGSRFAG